MNITVRPIREETPVRSRRNLQRETQQREARIAAIKQRIAAPYDNIRKPVPFIWQITKNK